MAPASPSRRATPIDGLRGLSALWVILYDLWTFQRAPDLGPLTPLIAHGHLGVEVFMVLSGFCLFFPIADRAKLAPGYWRDFYWRRIKRIVPPYWAAIAFAILAGWLTYQIQLAGPHAWRALWHLPTRWELGSHLVLIHNLFLDVRSAINPSFWSLSLEAQYYLLFPVAALALIRWPRWGLWALFAACLAVRQVGLGLYAHAPMAAWLWPFTSILGRLSIFVIGMLAARAWKAQLAHRWRWGAAAGWVGLGLGVAGAWSFSKPLLAVPTADLLVGAGSALVILHASRPGALGRWLSHPWLAGLGTISYSFYLTNRPTCLLVDTWVSQWAPAAWGADPRACMGLTMLLGLPLSLAIAAGFYRLVERPFMSTTSREATPRRSQTPRLDDAGFTRA